MTIHDNATALTKMARTFEGLGTNPMPKSDLVLFHDDFSDGRMHGWRPTHMLGGNPQNPVSVEPDYPFPGLFLATGSTPYRSTANSRYVQSWKGLMHRFGPLSGIVSFSAWMAIQSGGPAAGAYQYISMEMDMQNWDDSLRRTPIFQLANPGTGGPSQWQLVGDDGTSRNVTGIINPVTGDTVNSTKGLGFSENEGKWNFNYVRVSYDLGNLFQASTRTVTDGVLSGASFTSATAVFTALDEGRTVTCGASSATVTSVNSGTNVTLSGSIGSGSSNTCVIATTGGVTSNYYELNVNGFRFDLRSQGHGSGAPSTGPQAGTAIHEFTGGFNFGLQVTRSTASGNIYPARLIAGETAATYHTEGWQ